MNANDPDLRAINRERDPAPDSWGRALAVAIPLGVIGLLLIFAAAVR